MNDNGRRNAEQKAAVDPGTADQPKPCAWCLMLENHRDPGDIGRIIELEEKLAKADRAIRFFLEPGVEWNMEAWLDGSGPPPPEPALRRVLELEESLRALIERIRRVGGYATPEEQDDLRRAERVLRCAG